MTLKEILTAALATPQGREVLSEVGRALITGEVDYKRLHWGRDAHGASLERLEVGGHATELGALSHIGYVTEKGGDPAATDYLHEFGGAREVRPGLFHFRAPLPTLAVRQGDLVILRGRSRYRVTSHGIEG